MSNNQSEKKYEKGKCELLNCYEDLSHLKRNELLIDLFKFKWSQLTFNIMFGSLGIIFFVNILAIFFPNLGEPKTNSVEATGGIDSSFIIKIFEALQIWVGFSLGLIATIFSIISMWLSFYNLEQQKESEKNVRDLNEELNDNIIKEIKIHLESIKGELKDEILKTNKTLLAGINGLRNINITKDTTNKTEKMPIDSEHFVD